MLRLHIHQEPEKTLIQTTLQVLKAGGLVIFPTETTYGAGVDATNPEAVKKLLAYKARREGKPLSIAVPDMAMAEKYVELNTQARQLYRQFLPGPVTVISKGLGKVAPGVESEFGTLGVRIPDYELMLKIVMALGRPVTATSANPSDGARPYQPDKLLKTLSGRQLSQIDLLLDAGELPHNSPSSVIDTTLSAPVTMREGDIRLSTDQITVQSVDEPDTRLTIQSSNLKNHLPTAQLISRSPDQITDTSVADFNPSARILRIFQPTQTQPSPLILHSTSPEETMGIAGRLVLKHWNDVRKTGLIIGLNGPLGAGKTVFAQGVATFLGIKAQLVSPTYTYIEEYPFTRHQTTGMLFHLDMWKVDSPVLFERLEFEQLLGPNNIVVVEWWEQVREYIQILLPILEISVRDSK